VFRELLGSSPHGPECRSVGRHRPVPVRRSKRFVMLVASLACFLASCGVFPFKDHRVTEGEAYGFVVGESIADSYRRAVELQSEDKFVAFELGRGSGAVLLDPSQHDPLAFDHWQLVVDPTVWNDTIYLTFESSKLAEVWRE
jgi:hypothetical protein